MREKIVTASNDRDRILNTDVHSGLAKNFWCNSIETQYVNNSTLTVEWAQFYDKAAWSAFQWERP